MKSQKIKAKVKSKWSGVKPGWKSCFMVGITAFLLYLCITYWSVAAQIISGIIGAASPLIIGGIMAYPLNILMSFYERHWFKNSGKAVAVKLRRPVCLVLAIMTLIAIVALVLGLVVPQFIKCIKLVIDALPGEVNRLAMFLGKHNMLTERAADYINSIDWNAWLDKSISVITTGIGSVVGTVFTALSSVLSGIVTAVLSIIFAVYILAGKDRIGRQFDRVMKHYLKDRWYGKIKYTLEIINDCFRRYIVGQCIEAVILGVLCTIGMLILRLPYAPMIGALIALTALVPIAGAYIGAGVGAFLILMVSPIKAVIFLIFIVVLQQVEGNLIYPRVVGTSIGLPGIWVLAAVTIGGGIMGIGGMLLGVPLAAACYRIIRNDISKDAAKCGEGVETNADTNETGSGEEPVQQ